MPAKKIIFFLCLFLLFFPAGIIFAELSNIGFVPVNLWYSKSPLEEGDRVRIYTLIYNPDNRELSGTVAFFDETTLLGTKDFAIPALTAKDIWTNWTVSAGSHRIFAKIENAKFLLTSVKYEDVYLAENTTQESKISISKKIDFGKSAEVVSSLQEVVAENTPPFITRAIDATVQALENTREKTGIFSEKQKEVAKNEIEAFEKEEAKKQNTSPEDSKPLKPLKYLKFFFFAFLTFILNHKIVFYPILAIIVFLILRFLWRLIF